MEINEHDILIMKKKHPCGSNSWEVLKLGSDLKLKCTGCGHIIIVKRSDIVKKIKEVKKS
ncbi:MAG: DUF951 domain-containing protein [Lachnospiraceae bacterium]|nr:DUF951 domain-containing protein [Lachnospiraceae bacterium]